MNEWTMLVREALDRDDCWQINLRQPDTGRRITLIVYGDEVFTYIPEKQKNNNDPRETEEQQARTSRSLASSYFKVTCKDDASWKGNVG